MRSAVRLIRYSIRADKCTACGMCKKVCPVDAVSGAKKTPHKIDAAKCIKCGACMEACKFDAIAVE